MSALSTLFNALSGHINTAAQATKHYIYDKGGTEALVGQLYDQYNILYKLTTDSLPSTINAYAEMARANSEATAAVTEYTDQLAFLEKRNAEINKTFGVTSKVAARLSMTYQNVAKSLNTFNGEQAIAYGNSIRKMLPMLKQEGKENDKKQKGLMAIQHVITTNMQLTEDEAANFSMYASKAGDNAASLLDLAKAAAELAAPGDKDGSLGYMKMIVEGIADLGADMQLQYGRLGGNLEIAVLKANKLGVELEDLASAGDQLLNIESSIGDELEYQLLSGRRLVDQQSGESLTNMFRQATLMGDMSKQADTLNTILEQEGDTLENNLFARKQMSQLLGMDEASLARALQKKKLLESEPNLRVLMNLDGSALQAQAEAMYKNGEITEAKLEEIAKVADTRTQDDILKAQLKLQEESAKDMNELLTVNQEANALLLEQVYQSIDFSKLMITDKAKMVNRFQAQFGVDIESYGTDVTTKLATKKKDVMIPPGGSAPIISAPAGTFILDPQDTILAGTDPSLQNPTTSASVGGENNLSAVMLQVGRMIVAAINSKGSGVFGATSMNSGYYQGT